MSDIVSAIIEESERIEREKAGQALLPHEADAVKAVAFLRKIAPYLSDSAPSRTPGDQT